MFGFGFGSAVPAGTGPSQYFSDFDEAMKPAQDAAVKDAENRYAATVQMVNQAIDHTQTLANPVAPMAVPEGPNPGLAGLAGFFAHLNQAQGGGGAAVGNLGNTLSALAAQREQAISANEQSDRAFALSKFNTTEGLHQQLLTAMRDKSAEMGDLDKTFQHNKALYALERQKKQDDAKIAADLAAGKADVSQKNALERIRVRGEIEAKNQAKLQSLKKDAQSRALTPVQKAQMAEANAQVAELRATVDDMRGARDLAGDPVYSPEEISAKEDEVAGQISGMYKDLITKFETKGGAATETPAPTPTTPPPATNDRIKAAADRLRGTALFQQ